MNKILPLLLGLFFFSHDSASAQRICGAQLLKEAAIARHPEAKEQQERQRLSLQSTADNYIQQHTGSAAMKTTAAAAVPVIFHVIVNAAQFALLGGTDGIARRCDSQIAVLNRDFNRQNSDSALIPASFKPLYSSVGIQFGLAHTSPSGFSNPGYEIKIITSDGFNGADTSYPAAKHYSRGGLDAWDVNKYLNIWCINFLDYPGLIGLTVAPSFLAAVPYTAGDKGVCLTYNVFGARAASTDNYPAHFDEGRSLTHEVGHFFEIWHPWGDDGGQCPPPGTGSDDGLADTPPEGNNASGSPAGPVFDACSPSTGNGVMWMNYMDYCNDDAVHMFTIQQSAVMAAQVASGGESYTLTQNPDLLNWGLASVPGVAMSGNGFNIYPNPATGVINIAFDGTKDVLAGYSVLNTLGQELIRMNTSTEQKDFYSIDLSGMSKGIYFVRCNFASGSTTKKIVLQ